MPAAGMTCNCPHHKIVPGLIILIGLTFLLGALGALSDEAVAIIWPILLILVGGNKMMSGKCKCCKNHVCKM